MTGRKSTPRLGSSGPHPFVEPPDPRLGLALAAGSATTAGWNQGAVPVAAATLRERRCAKPGCGKTRDDAIHLPPD